MQNRNPYAAPQTNVAHGDVPADEEHGEVRIFSVSGRLGRVRYIGYSMGMYLLIGILMVAFLGVFAGVGVDPSTVLMFAMFGYVAMLIVLIMLTIQRAHDMNTTGWLSVIVFIPLAALVFWLVPGTRGENEYGKQPPPNTVGVILLACLAPLFFIGSILAAIAIPAYQDYAIRAQVSEGLNLAAEPRAAVADAFERMGRAPADREEAGLPVDATETSGQYVASVDVASGTILVSYGRGANPMIAGRVLALQPYVTTNGSVVWRCGHAAVAPGAAAMDERALAADEATDLEPRYLPSACRP